MKISAISLNQTEHYPIRYNDRKFIKEVREVYIFDSETRTHCCEAIPSYKLRYLHTFIVWQNDPSEQTRELLDSRYCYGENEDPLYMHCETVKALSNPPVKECGEFESIESAREHLQSNWPF